MRQLFDTAVLTALVCISVALFATYKASVNIYCAGNDCPPMLFASQQAPTEDDLPCAGGCKCDDGGTCKCFVSTAQEACRCKKCTCKDEGQ